MAEGQAILLLSSRNIILAFTVALFALRTKNGYSQTNEKYAVSASRMRGGLTVKGKTWCVRHGPNEQAFEGESWQVALRR